MDINYGRIILFAVTLALLTYLTRMVTLVLFRKKIRNRFIMSFLTYVPYGILSAMIFPNIIYSTDSLIPSIAGGLTAFLLSSFEMNLMVVSAGAVLAVFIAQLII
ncbi:MAG: AzlD domain-containing protein [Firmicutes bacterium]|nr:AzlD domain-containing protein [Bacillota bacterium]